MGYCIKLDRNEFCTWIRSSHNSWIFDGEDEKKAKYWLDPYDHRAHYYNGVDTDWQFMLDVQHGLKTILASHSDHKSNMWSGWTTWWSSSICTNTHDGA